MIVRITRIKLYFRMKNFLITPFLFKNKYKKIVFGLNHEWYEFAKKNKLNLIIINNKNELDIIFKIKIHGLILSGGNDLSDIKKTTINSLREKNEIEIIKYIIKKRLPIIGICRGFQLIVFNFGIVPTRTKFHVKKNHKIYFSDNNFLKKKFIGVNSYHNYSINKLPKEFKNIASHVDKSIEIASYKDNINCFMFHPERPNSSQNAVNSYFKKVLQI